jgi:hypothetical protein
MSDRLTFGPKYFLEKARDYEEVPLPEMSSVYRLKLNLWKSKIRENRYPKLVFCLPMCGGKTTLSKECGFTDVDTVPLSKEISDLRDLAHKTGEWDSYNAQYYQVVADYCKAQRVECILVHGPEIAYFLRPLYFGIAKPVETLHKVWMLKRKLPTMFEDMAKKNWADLGNRAYQYDDISDFLVYEFRVRQSMAEDAVKMQTSRHQDQINNLIVYDKIIPDFDTYGWLAIDTPIHIKIRGYSVEDDTVLIKQEHMCHWPPVIKLVPIQTAQVGAAKFDALFTYDDCNSVYDNKHGLLKWDRAKVFEILGTAAEHLIPVGMMSAQGDSIIVHGSMVAAMVPFSKPCNKAKNGEHCGPEADEITGRYDKAQYCADRKRFSAISHIARHKPGLGYY